MLRASTVFTVIFERSQTATMAKAKRMSEIFTSSSEKDPNTTTVTATPPYSSEGPTLPIVGATDSVKKASKKKMAQDGAANTATKKPSQPPPTPTMHPSLYEPWRRLPPELLKLLETQSRLRATQNIVPVVFSKNQNVKSGINRLKTYMGAYRDAASTIEMPDALKEQDLVIAASAQGEGTTKLVGIVDMVRRLVAPSGNNNERVEMWWMYTSLTSVEIERKPKKVQHGANGGEEGKKTQSTQEDEAFERMDVDGLEEREKESDEDGTQMRKVPVLTIWMTRKKIPAFKSAFGEQAFSVQLIPREEV
jgi:hypothetical protein